MNDSSLWLKPGWKDRHKLICDIISYNDVTSALSSYECRRNIRFTGVQILKKFQSNISLLNFLNAPRNSCCSCSCSCSDSSSTSNCSSCMYVKAVLLENSHLLAVSSQRNGICEVLYAAAWICGEFSELVFFTAFIIRQCHQGCQARQNSQLAYFWQPLAP